MLLGSPKVLCTARPDPKAWEFNGRSGVSYKVSVSDGTSNLELPVKDAETWNRFVPFGNYIITVEVSQVANDNRLSTRCRIVDVKDAK